MTYVPLQEVYIPDIRPYLNPGIAVTTIDGTTEKYAWIGSVFWKDRSVTTRDIRRARFLYGTVSKASGSSLTLSWQDLDAVTGPTGRPDGTQDQTVTVANGDAGFVTGNFYTTGNFSADRTVTLGQRLSLVAEFASWTTPDAVNFAALSHFTGSAQWDGPAFFNGTAWATTDCANILVLEFADGEIGCLLPFLPQNANANIFEDINLNSTPDEIGQALTPNFKCKIDGIAYCIQGSASADFDIVLYEGTTALQTVSINAKTLKSGSPYAQVTTIPETELTPGTTYYLAIKPTTGNNVRIRAITAPSNAVMQLGAGSGIAYYASRVNAGAWTVTDTKRPFISARLSAIDSGAGGAAGGVPIIGYGGGVQ